MAKKILSFAALVITILVTGCNANPDTPPKEEEKLPKLTVTFDTVGGSPVPKPVKVSKGESIGNFPSDPSRELYKFMGWYTGKNGLGEKFTSKTKVVKDQTVYAYWTLILDPPPPPPTILKVTFDAAGGSPALQTRYVYERERIGISDFPPEPSRQSYRFMGWYTGENGQGNEFTARTTVNKNQTVYAYWILVKTLTGIEVAEPIGDILMGNFSGQVFDRSNFTINNVYDDGSKSETENYTASINASTGMNIFTAGKTVKVTFTSTENADYKTTITRPVSKTLANTGLPVVYIDTKDAAPIVDKKTM